MAEGGGGRGGARGGLEDATQFETSAGVKTVDDFSSMNLKEDLLRGLYAYGFEKPSAIQQRAVVPILSGRDVIAQAQSGTGKTSMIALTLCQMVDINTRECVPTCSDARRGASTRQRGNAARARARARVFR